MSEQSPGEGSYFEGDAAGKFKDYEDTVRGRVRYEVTRTNLCRYLPSLPIKAADVGGGSGPDSAWLAGMGHETHLYEPASDQVDLAFIRRDDLPFITQNRFFIHEGLMDDVPVTEKGSFDLVLSHCVTMYLEDPMSHYKSLSELVGKGGLISVLEKNFAGKELSLIRENKFDDLNDLYTTGWTEENRTGMRSRAFKPEELEDMLEKSGFEVLGKYAVRTFSEIIDQPWGSLEIRKRKDLILSEIENSLKPEQIDFAQMVHIVARKK